jgi:hypothetical protein
VPEVGIGVVCSVGVAGGMQVILPASHLIGVVATAVAVLSITAQWAVQGRTWR